MQNLRLLACVVVTLGSLTAAGCGSDNDCDSDNLNDPDCFPSGGSAAVVVVKNPCTVPISEIHVAAVGTENWQANLISATVSPSASGTIAVACGHYAVELVGQVGQVTHKVTVDDVYLCAGKADLTIDSATCAAFTPLPPPKDPVAGPASSAAN